MIRTTLMAAILIGLGGASRASQDVYPPLTRETLIGTWQGVVGIGAHPVVLHVVIAARDTDSYLSEIYPDSMKGSLFRLVSCTITDGKVDLDFRPPGSCENCVWRIQGEGFGDKRHAWINSRIGYFERSTWVRELGEAAAKAAEKIPKSGDGHK